MHITFIEKDPLEKETIAKILREVFPQVPLTCLPTASDFLKNIPKLQKDELIITEHFLPLMFPEEDYEEKLHALEVEFPRVVIDWDYHSAAETLIRHLRRVGLDLPVIIYTHSEEGYIDADVLQDAKVRYCEKGKYDYHLIRLIKEMHASTK